MAIAPAAPGRTPAKHVALTVQAVISPDMGMNRRAHAAPRGCDAGNVYGRPPTGRRPGPEKGPGRGHPQCSSRVQGAAMRDAHCSVVAVIHAKQTPNIQLRFAPCPAGGCGPGRAMAVIGQCRLRRRDSRYPPCFRGMTAAVAGGCRRALARWSSPAMVPRSPPLPPKKVIRCA